METMKVEEIARERLGLDNADLGGTGNRVLPISEATLFYPSNDAEDQDEDLCSLKAGKKERVNSARSRDVKIKAMAKVKELILRSWAASKPKKGGRKLINLKVLYFGNRERTLKAVVDVDEEQLNNESPKMSFQWEVESCATTSSAYSPPRRGNWITTDSDFVVLEL